MLFDTSLNEDILLELDLDDAIQNKTEQEFGPEEQSTLNMDWEQPKDLKVNK